MDKIVLGGIVRDRAALVPIWIDGLVESARYLLLYIRSIYSDIAIDYVFIDDYSKDDTHNVLKDTCYKHKIPYNRIYSSKDFSIEDSTRDVNTRPYYDYKRLALLRDLYINLSFRDKDTTHTLMVDSDIQIPKDTLVKLYGSNKCIIAALVRNSIAPKIFNFLLKDNDNPTGYSRRNVTKDTLTKTISNVDLTGACILLNRYVYNTSIKYYNTMEIDDKGFTEDVSFAIACERHGIKPYLRTDIDTVHYMTEKNHLHSLPIKEEDYA